VPCGPPWASKSAAQRWLQRWQADGTLARMQDRLLGSAEERGMIRWRTVPLMAPFPPGKGGGEEVARGGKGQGSLIHSLTGGAGMALATGTTPERG
jgi:hypothetical protein